MSADTGEFCVCFFMFLFFLKENAKFMVLRLSVCMIMK